MAEIQKEMHPLRRRMFDSGVDAATIAAAVTEAGGGPVSARAVRSIADGVTLSPGPRVAQAIANYFGMKGSDFIAELEAWTDAQAAA